MTAIAQYDLSNDTVTEHDEDESTQKFREGLSEDSAYSRPQQSRILRLLHVGGQTSIDHWAMLGVRCRRCSVVRLCSHMAQLLEVSCLDIAVRRWYYFLLHLDMAD